MLNKKKPRDKKTGRYIPWINTEYQKYLKKNITIDDVRNAYISGFNDQGGVRRPSHKADQYLKIKGFI